MLKYTKSKSGSARVHRLEAEMADYYINSATYYDSMNLSVSNGKPVPEKALGCIPVPHITWFARIV